MEERHLAELTLTEVSRALRALSSCYVERRSRLSSGGALDSRGKRAAFALFYGPLHFFVTRHVVAGLNPAPEVEHVIDLGCGTGAAGAAWATGATARISGSDANAWAAREATWTYREFGLRGRAVQGDAVRFVRRAGARDGILLAYVVNELESGKRAELLESLLCARPRGAHVLVIEPISRRISPWWSEWERAFAASRGRSDEWRFPPDLPRTSRHLAKAAGLDPKELTARSLWM